MPFNPAWDAALDNRKAFHHIILTHPRPEDTRKLFAFNGDKINRSAIEICDRNYCIFAVDATVKLLRRFLICKNGMSCPLGSKVVASS